MGVSKARVSAQLGTRTDAAVTVFIDDKTSMTLDRAEETYGEQRGILGNTKLEWSAIGSKDV
jgi:hypothetical protein